MVGSVAVDTGSQLPPSNPHNNSYNNISNNNDNNNFTATTTTTSLTNNDISDSIKNCDKDNSKGVISDTETDVDNNEKDCNSNNNNNDNNNDNDNGDREIVDIRSTRLSEFGNLENMIIAGLTQQPPNQKSLPTLILYDDRGLQLFNRITYLEEYYLTVAEIDILETHAEDIAMSVPVGGVVIELGSGSLRKTRIILEALNKHQKNVTYYALDLMERELKASINSLNKYENINVKGLWGTYDDGKRFVRSLPPGTHKTFLWLGSSIGNLARDGAREFLSSYQLALSSNDMFVIGIDGRNDPELIRRAYNDSEGVTREFTLNGLSHINVILGKQDFINRENFEHRPGYNTEKGCHEVFFESKIDQTLEFNGKKIHIAEGERIHIENSFKYSPEEVKSLMDSVNLDIVTYWTDSLKRYNLYVCRKP